MQIDEYLVGGWATPLKNMSSSIGMMIIPNINGKIKSKWQPNHEPDIAKTAVKIPGIQLIQHDGFGNPPMPMSFANDAKLA